MLSLSCVEGKPRRRRGSRYRRSKSLAKQAQAASSKPNQSSKVATPPSSDPIQTEADTNNLEKSPIFVKDANDQDVKNLDLIEELSTDTQLDSSTPQVDHITETNGFDHIQNSPPPTSSTLDLQSVEDDTLDEMVIIDSPNDHQEDKLISLSISDTPNDINHLSTALESIQAPSNLEKVSEPPPIDTTHASPSIDNTPSPQDHGDLFSKIPPSMSEITLSRLQLSTIPYQLVKFGNLLSLELSKNSIQDISPLVACHSLIHLDLNNNFIEKIPCSFSLLNLQSLDLSDNFITTIPSTISSLTNLTYFQAIRNKIANMDNICMVASLRELDLTQNLIEEIPSTIANLTNLTDLNLSLNRINHVSDTIGCLKAIVNIILHDNLITEMPRQLNHTSSTLNRLDLSHNLLTHFPLDVIGGELSGQFKNLQYLNLSYNKLSGSLNDQTRLFDVHNAIPILQLLKLNDNQIESLSINGDDIESLIAIDIRHNAVKQLDDLFNSFDLEEIHLGWNQITAIPEKINLQSLQILNLFGNQLKTLPSLTSLANLNNLNIAYNLLTEVNIEGLFTLQELSISNNPLGKLPNNLNHHCPNLRVLYANHIQLRDIPESIGELNGLQQLDLSHNHLSTVPMTIRDLEWLASIDLSHNSLESSPSNVEKETLGQNNWDTVNIWSRMFNLLEVNLSFNQLCTIPQGLAPKAINSRRSVHLEGNPCKPIITTGHTFSGKSAITDTDESQPRTGISVGWADMMGCRQNMEDALVTNLNVGPLERNCHFFALFDGHGGHEFARFCAKHIYQLVLDNLNTPEVLTLLESNDQNDVAKFMEGIFTQLGNKLRQTYHNKMKRMNQCGTTAVLVLLVDDMLHVAHVGDSRAVLSTGHRCTEDHKPNYEITRIRAIPGGFLSSDAGICRIDDQIAVSRALGDFDLLPYISSTPDVFSRRLTLDEKFIILACDGVWDEVTDAGAAQLIEPLVTQGLVFQAATKLRDFAYSSGSIDNISVMVIKRY